MLNQVSFKTYKVVSSPVSRMTLILDCKSQIVESFDNPQDAHRWIKEQDSLSLSS